jgi:hypothetical protein
MELSGVRFGRLVVLRRSTSGRRVPWVCRCDCGVVVTKAQSDLRRGDTTSCGCAKRDATIARNYKHGMADTPTHLAWKRMRRRVRHPEDVGNACYQNVKIYKRWDKFANFLADMGEVPKGYSLDRKDNRKGYSPANCRWVPLSEQAKNTRRLHKLGDTYLTEAARRAGLDPDVVSDRINKLGWDMQRALTTPKRFQQRRK